MDGRTARKFRKRLLSELGERGQLLGKIRQSVTERSARMSAEGGLFGNHMADAANEDSERETDYLIVDNQGRDLQEIEKAIQRLDEGIYGACEACGSDIETRRLEVHPSARFCLRCQERQERFGRN